MATVLVTLGLAAGVTAAGAATGEHGVAHCGAGSGVACAGSSLERADGPDARVRLGLRLRDVRVRHRDGRHVLSGRPVRRGAENWVQPDRPRRRLGARRVATIWAAVQGPAASVARISGKRLRLLNPRLSGKRFRARLVGRNLNVPAGGILRANLRHHDQRTPGNCPLAPFARCVRAQMMHDDLHRGDLRGADLRAANLHGAFAHSATLAGADLRGSDLRGATLSGADLRRANLANTHLADANLHHARYESQQLAEAHLCRTKLRDGSISERDCDATPPRLHPPSALLIDPGAARAAGSPESAGAAPLLSTGERLHSDPAIFRSSSEVGLAANDSARSGRRTKRRGKVALRLEVTGPGRVVGPNINCPRECTARYRRGKVVTITASADPKAMLGSWSGACKGARQSCRLRMNRTRKATAAFAATDPTTCPHPANSDSDDDGLFDCVEWAGWTIQVTTEQTLGGAGPERREVSSVVGNGDSDGDGVSDGHEFHNNGDPESPDTDADGLSDEAELKTYGTNLSHADSDGDSLPDSSAPRAPRLFDGNEVRATPPSNPRVADTDGDSLSDYYEIVTANTNPMMADLPNLGLGEVNNKTQVQIDLPYTVTLTDGTEQEQITATQVSTSSTRSNRTTNETTNETSQEHQAGGGCEVDAGAKGGVKCSAHYQYTNTKTHSHTSGTEVGFDDTQGTTQENQQLAQTSAERKVTFEAAGCLQVEVMVTNDGAASVEVSDIQLIADTPDPDNPGESKLLATLLPVSGEIFAAKCPGTDEDFATTIGPGGSERIGFSQQVSAGILREYIANPTSIQFTYGAVTMKGTNSAHEEVNFSGVVAGDVSRLDTSITVDFGDGTIRDYQIAAGIERENGAPAGITLSEALGPALADLEPQWRGDPSYLSGLRNPATGEAVTTVEDDPRQGAWALIGDAEGIGDPSETGPWDEIVLKPGNQIALAYTKDTDGDGVLDSKERQLGTDREEADTDGDGLNDFIETQTGWTVPLAREHKESYTVLSSPLSCDADGDGSPDGPGPGNDFYGECPDSPYPPESSRAATTGDGGNGVGGGLLELTALEGTDPTLADSNADGLLDGNQPYPDVVREVGKGGRTPQFVVQWGGTGEGSGSFERAGAIAVDRNQPAVDDEGKLLPVDSYVADSAAAGVTKFSGNPAAGDGTAPVFQWESFWSTDAPAMGLVVTAQAAGSGQTAGRILATNHLNEDQEEDSPRNAIERVNGTTHETAERTRTYSGRFGWGFLDAKPSGDLFLSRGLSSDNREWNNDRTDTLPCLLGGRGANFEAVCARSYGRKAADPAAPKRGELVDPSGLAYSEVNDELYVADDVALDWSAPGDAVGRCIAGPRSLTAFDASTGAVRNRLAEDPSDPGLCPAGVAVDPSGDYIYVANKGYQFKDERPVNMVWKLSPSLTVLARWGTYDDGEVTGERSFKAPYDLDVDRGGSVWVTDSASNLIQYFFYPFGPD